MPLAPDDAREVRSLWLSRFGVDDQDALDRDGVTIGLHDPAWYWGVQLLQRGDACVVSVPTQELRRAVERVRFDPRALREALGSAVTAVIGPAVITHRSEVAKDAARGEPLADADALARLEAACGDVEVEHASIDLDHPVVLGASDGEGLAGAVSAEPWGGRIYDVGLLVHPRARGRGVGSALTAACVEAVCARGGITQYRTLRSNKGSMAIAERLGFELFAETLSARLEP